MTPLWVVAFSYFFLGHLERVTPLYLFAAVLVVMSGTLIMTE
jgi:drug/metabolite transporter (DMT)-like permease